MEQDALELLTKASNNVEEVVRCVHKFANWWDAAETMISSLRDQVVSADGRRLSLTRINMVKNSWELLKQDYEVYKRKVSDL
jgi:hypothetical protein